MAKTRKKTQKKTQKTNAQLEDAFQREVVKYLRDVLDDQPISWTAVDPDHVGGWRGAIRKARGVKAGIPDLIFWLKSDGTHAKPFGIELKTKTGTVRESQKAMAKTWESLGLSYYIARDMKEVVDNLKKEGVHLRKLPLSLREKKQ